MEKRWKIKSASQSDSEIVDCQKTLTEKGKKVSSVILQLLKNRGIVSEKEIDGFFSFDYENDIHDPFLFADMNKAVSRIIEAQEKKEKIAVFGDYDADGVTATALMAQTLEALGFSGVHIYIPDRQIEGYGMNYDAVDFLAKKGVKLVITVDCGITGIEEVARAKKAGMDVIITDHHHVPNRLPEALAIINPHLENSAYPFCDLSGVGTAFKLADALYRKIKPKEKEQLKWLLDLVAIGTIADCVPLLGENRILTKYGLIVLSKTKRIGFLEMFKVGRIAIDENNLPDTQKVAFQISPRINAAGRMDHASISFNLIMEKEQTRARELALEVEDTNQSRQKITGEIVRGVRALAENSFKDKKLIFAANIHWRVGILGLIAGKIADEFRKPTAIFQKQDTEFVGSLRSIPQVNIIEALEKCSELLVKFGGHAQAAGVRVAHDKMEKFYEKLDGIIERELSGKDISPEIEIDMEIKLQDISWDMIADIKKMEPFGEGNSEPVFLAKDAVVEGIKIVGNGNKHIKLTLRANSGGPKIFEAIGFGMGEKFSSLKPGDVIQMVFNLQEDEWNGSKKMQMKIIDLKLQTV
ncbi:MAG: single-stranded-DNA-specific exonuclease RecJ [Candidatus Moranbacteria bacterium CG_4_9_14_3_um_filter_42_9]|nr:MAG: single-stranded-DNA-specific exonuclease RecJ [Candidatus Moranbacteria bacterium CG_4_9_14_3_um_filter_42_9]